jgi:hypothetical protein
MILGEEIVDINFKLYDKLISMDDSFCPIAESGFLKIKLPEKPRRDDADYFVYNQKDHCLDTKKYIENRLCKENDIRFLRVFDKNNWHDTICGEFVSKMDGEFLIISVVKKATKLPADAKECTIMLNDITPQNVESIILDCENCDGVVVNKDEIIDIDLKFKNTLEWASHDLVRVVESGYIKTKFNKKIAKRLLGEFDICHLYVEYDTCVCGTRRRECIDVDGLEYGEAENYDDYVFVSGMGKKQKDGTILLNFGNQACEKLI